MPVFEYEARAADGLRSKGIVEADSEQVVRRRLRGEGKYPVRISLVRKSPSLQWHPAKMRLPLTGRVSPSEIHVFTRQLATLIAAGIPLDTALSAIVDQVDNHSLKRIVIELKASVTRGDMLSRALEQHRRTFSSMYVSMVRAGEAFGSLDLVLLRLAEFGETQEFIGQRIRAAMIYPAFMTVVGVGVLFILVTFVVPDIMQVYDRMDETLPWPTRILLGAGRFLQQHWWLFVVLTGGIVILTANVIRRPWGKRAWDRLLLQTPVIGALFNKAMLFRFSSTLAPLLKSGVDVIGSLEISKRVVDNHCFIEVIDEVIEDINVGRPMAGPLARSKWFPATFVQMVAVGEASGQLEEMLEMAGKNYERELQSALLGITALIEPLLIVIMGVFVGFIVLSILLPIFEMSQVIG